MGPRYATLPSTIPVEPFSPPFHVSFDCLALQRFPFIVKFLSLGQPQLHLRFSIGEIEPKRNEGKSPLLRLPDEAPDLTLMEEKFSRSQRVMVEPVCMTVRINMSIDKKDFSVFYLRITVAQGGFPVPEGLHLGPEKNHPCLEPVFDKIFVPGFPVLANQFFSHDQKSQSARNFFVEKSTLNILAEIAA